MARRDPAISSTHPASCGDHDDVRRVVSTLSCFGTIDDAEQLSQLSNGCHLVELAQDEQLFCQGDTADFFYVVLEGRLKIVKLSSEGKEIILHLLGVDELVGAVPIFNGFRQYPANAQALEPTRLLCVNGNAFLALMIQYPQMARVMVAFLATRLLRFSELIEDLSLRTVEGRLAKYMLSVSSNANNKAVITIQKKELAAILGTVPETLSRTFNKLSKEGLIKVTDNTIEVLERSALSVLAN